MKPSENLKFLLWLRFAVAGPCRRSGSGCGRVAASKGLSARLSPGRTSEGTGGSRGWRGAGAERGAGPSPVVPPFLSSLLSAGPTGCGCCQT